MIYTQTYIKKLGSGVPCTLMENPQQHPRNSACLFYTSKFRRWILLFTSEKVDLANLHRRSFGGVVRESSYRLHFSYRRKVWLTSGVFYHSQGRIWHSRGFKEMESLTKLMSVILFSLRTASAYSQHFEILFCLFLNHLFQLFWVFSNMLSSSSLIISCMSSYLLLSSFQ